MTIATYIKPDLSRLLSPKARRSAEMEELWQWIVAQEAKDLDNFRVLTAQEARALSARASRCWNIDLPEMAAIDHLSIAGLDGAPAISAELLTPPDAQPGCILFVHGGGWAFSNLETHQRAMRLLALECGTRVLGIDYRLAPEHPYPAPLEDVVAAWRWLVAQSAHDPALAGPLAIAGDSAGANLVLGCIMHENELGHPAPHAGLLFYGIFSADLNSPSYVRFATGYGLTRERMGQYFDWYVPATSPESRRFDPLVNPVAASGAVLAKLPMLYLNAAGLDVLLCDAVAFAEKLKNAGADFEFVLHEGVHHGFMQFSAHLEESRRAFRMAGDFFRRKLR